MRLVHIHPLLFFLFLMHTYRVRLILTPSLASWIELEKLKCEILTKYLSRTRVWGSLERLGLPVINSHEKAPIWKQNDSGEQEIDL